MKRHHIQIQCSAHRQAFTLVELLVVIAIIVILASLTMFMVSKVSTSSKVTKTRGTIQKIDTAMQQIFMSYYDRFVLIKSKIAHDEEMGELDKVTQQMIAAHFIRDLMRMELPQNWLEVLEDPIPMTGGYVIEESPLLYFYQAEYDRVLEATNKPPSRAALLFLIIQNLNPEALDMFHGSEIADTDGDGLYEFVDAWGNPIQFLRWAPAFPGSDLQQDVLREARYTPDKNMNTNREWWEKGLPATGAARRVSGNHPDVQDGRVNVVPGVVGWFLYPLIYSAGPDGDYGIDDGEDIPPALGKEGILDPFAFPYGMPIGNGHFDNIHNHQWYKSF